MGLMSDNNVSWGEMHSNIWIVMLSYHAEVTAKQTFGDIPAALKGQETVVKNL